MLGSGSFADKHDVRIEIFAFIEGYHNTHRKHFALGYRGPDRFEAYLNSLN
jgi:transposase InsO family protein